MLGRAWDAHLSVRSLWLSATIAVLAISVIAATEEGGGWPARLALWSIGAPMMGAVGSWVAVRWSRVRGEARALETVGVAPLRMVLGAAVGGTLLGLLGAIAILSGWADPLALAPPPIGTFDWVQSGDGMLSPSQGIFVASDGTTAMVPITELPTVPLSRWPFAASTAMLAAVLPLWACLPARPSRRVVAALVATAALVLSFHGAIAGVWTPLSLLSAPLWLMADTALRRHGHS